MAMKKKNSLPDMYSPEKKFSGFFAYMACWSRKQKKNLQNQLQKKSKKEQIFILCTQPHDFACQPL